VNSSHASLIANKVLIINNLFTPIATVGEGEREGKGKGKRERSTRKIPQHASATTPNHTYMGVREEHGVKDKGVMTSDMLQEDPGRQLLNPVAVGQL
jgi:hypothetical protein